MPNMAAIPRTIVNMVVTDVKMTLTSRFTSESSALVAASSSVVADSSILVSRISVMRSTDLILNDSKVFDKYDGRAGVLAETGRQFSEDMSLRIESPISMVVLG